MTPCNMYLVFLMPIYSICLLVLVAFLGVCDGVTLYVNSRFPPPPPFVTTLYRAPQTYDRGKSSKAPRLPFILISKVRPCYYHSESGRHFGLVRPGSLTRPQDNHRMATTPVPTHRPVWASSLGLTDHQFRQHLWPAKWSVSRSPPLASYSNSAFKGNWQIIKPILKEDVGGHEVIKYNKDGTRVVPEIIYRYHTREPQIISNKLQDTTTSLVNVFTDESITTEQPAPFLTSDTTLANHHTTISPRIPLTAQYQVFGSTKQLQMDTTAVPYISTTLTTTPLTSSTDQETTVAASITFKTTTSTLKSSTTTPKSSTAIPTLAPISVVTTFLVHDVVPSTSTEKSKDSIISKLGGGAKTVLNSIFGGLISNRRKTDMIKGKNKMGDIFNDDNYTVDSQQWTEEHLNNYTNRYNLSFATNTTSKPMTTSEAGITTQLPNSILDHFHFLQELHSLEKPNATRPSLQPQSNGLTNPSTTVGILPTTTSSTFFTILEENSTNIDLASLLFSHDENTTLSIPFNLEETINATSKKPWLLNQSPEYEREPISTLEPQWSEEENRTGEVVEDYPDLFPWGSSDEIGPEMTDSQNSKTPTTLSPKLNGKNNSPNSCPDCEEEQHNMDTTENGLTTSTSGWRPLRRPLPFNPNPPRAPAPGPFSIHHWLHSTWNDTFDWWKEKPDEEASPEYENTTEKSISKSWFAKIYNDTSVHHPSLHEKDPVTTYRPLSPIHWLFGLKENEGVTGKEHSHSNESKNVSSALQLFEELLAESEEENKETRIKEGVEIIDVPKSRIRPTKFSSVQMDGRDNSFGQLLQSVPIDKRTGHFSNTSASTRSNEANASTKNHSEYLVTSQERLKLDRSSEDGDMALDQKQNASKSLIPTEMITEISKFYSKLRLGLPLPFDIMEPLITMKYEALNNENYFYN